MILLTREQWEQILLVQDDNRIDITMSNGRQRAQTSETFDNKDSAAARINLLVTEAGINGFIQVQMSPE